MCGLEKGSEEASRSFPAPSDDVSRPQQKITLEENKLLNRLWYFNDDCDLFLHRIYLVSNVLYSNQKLAGSFILKIYPDIFHSLSFPNELRDIIPAACPRSHPACSGLAVPSHREGTREEISIRSGTKAPPSCGLHCMRGS